MPPAPQSSPLPQPRDRMKIGEMTRCLLLTLSWELDSSPSAAAWEETNPVIHIGDLQVASCGPYPELRGD
jgi:hypothetical protein